MRLHLKFRCSCLIQPSIERNRQKQRVVLCNSRNHFFCKRCRLKLTFHVTDTDILVNILSRIVTRMSMSVSVSVSVSASWNSSFTTSDLSVLVHVRYQYQRCKMKFKIKKIIDFHEIFKDFKARFLHRMIHPMASSYMAMVYRIWLLQRRRQSSNRAHQ